MFATLNVFLRKSVRSCLRGHAAVVNRLWTGAPRFINPDRDDEMFCGWIAFSAVSAFSALSRVLRRIHSRCHGYGRACRATPTMQKYGAGSCAPLCVDGPSSWSGHVDLRSG